MKYLIVLLVSCAIFACSQHNKNKHLLEQKIAYSSGYRDGCNILIDMLENGEYTPEKLMIQHFIDSTIYANMIDGKKIEIAHASKSR